MVVASNTPTYVRARLDMDRARLSPLLYDGLDRSSESVPSWAGLTAVACAQIGGTLDRR